MSVTELFVEGNKIKLLALSEPGQSSCNRCGDYFNDSDNRCCEFSDCGHFLCLACVTGLSGGCHRQECRSKRPLDDGDRRRKLAGSYQNEENLCVSLFPQVWSILGLHFEAKQIPPYNVPLSSILTLRLVCRDWCRGVDEFFDNFRSNLTSFSFNRKWSSIQEEADLQQKTGSNPSATLRECYTFSEENWNWNTLHKQHPVKLKRKSLLNGEEFPIQAFLNHFEQTHGNSERNPVIGRYITLSTRDVSKVGIRKVTLDLPGIYHNQVNDFLVKYGRHIWYCDICIDENFDSQSAYFGQIRDWLKRMPNLKTFGWSKFAEFGSPHSSRPENGMDPHKNSMELEEAIQTFGVSLFPRLVHLERVHLAHLPTEIVDLFLLSNGHVRVVSINGSFSPDLNGVTLPNLKDLHLLLQNDDDFKQFQKTRQNWALESLAIQFDPVAQCFSTISWASIIELVERWKETLVAVDISFPAMNLPNSPPISLNLPKLKQARVSFFSRGSLDFLLPTSSTLEHLKLECSVDMLGTPAEYLGWMKKEKAQLPFFCTPQLWEKFPKLERFYLFTTYGGCSLPDRTLFTRTGMEARQRKEDAKRRRLVDETQTGPVTFSVAFHNQILLHKEFELAADNLVAAWFARQKMDLSLAAMVDMKRTFIDVLIRYSDNNLFPTSQSYFLANELKSAGATRKLVCAFCPHLTTNFADITKHTEHFGVTHFLYQRYCGCDQKGCSECRATVKEVLVHRRSHFLAPQSKKRKLKQTEYQLKYVPRHNLTTEMKLVFDLQPYCLVEPHPCASIFQQNVIPAKNLPEAKPHKFKAQPRHWPDYKEGLLDMTSWELDCILSDSCSHNHEELPMMASLISSVQSLLLGQMDPTFTTNSKCKH